MKVLLDIKGVTSCKENIEIKVLENELPRCIICNAPIFEVHPNRLYCRGDGKCICTSCNKEMNNGEITKALINRVINNN
jgi:hypothetical protein